MRAILFFCGWLILCYTPIAAKEFKFSGSNAPTTFIQASTPAPKKKKLFETKFKHQAQKARLSVTSHIIPKLLGTATSSVSASFVRIIPLIYHRLVSSIFKSAIFIHIYPKHAFW